MNEFLYSPAGSRRRPASPQEDPCRQKELDKVLRRRFAAEVASLALSELVVPLAGRSSASLPEDYRLCAFVGEQSGIWESYYAAHSQVIIPEGVEVNYSRPGNPPFMETQFGIGLVYRDHAVAIACGGIEKAGQLFVPQIQGLVRRNENQRGPVRGLGGGFYWRDTLVNAWKVVGTTIGASRIEIQSGRNSLWWTSDRAQRFYQNYDAVAERMQFTQDGTTCNWRRSL